MEQNQTREGKNNNNNKNQTEWSATGNQRACSSAAFRFDLIQKRAEKTEAFNAQQYVPRGSDTNNGPAPRRLSTRHSPQ